MRNTLPNRDFSKELIKLKDGIFALPIIHSSVEFTRFVRELFLHSPPALVALELPHDLSAPITRALPEAENIPIISIKDKNDEEVFFIMEPLEPLTEALRSSYELKIPFHLIDSFLPGAAAWEPESFPDTYALRHISPAEFYTLYEKRIGSKQPDQLRELVASIDRIREARMAERIRNLSHVVQVGPNLRNGFLVICGFRHIAGLKRMLNLNHDDFSREIMEIGKVEDENEEDEREPLESLLQDRELQDKTANQAQISVLSRETVETLELPGYYNTAWNLARKNPGSVRNFDRITLQRSVYRDVVNRYDRESGEITPPQREKVFFRFARNWSITEGHLLPDAYKMIISARGFGGDNFARMMYDTLSFLPPLRNSSFKERKLTLDEIHRDSRMIRFRMKMKIKRRVPPPPAIRKFRREKRPGEWQETWKNEGICSYPPEDIQIEDFGTYLQNRARALLQGSDEKILPFTASLMDGIDYRETIRNYHQGKIFVRDRSIKGTDIGSVVVIFSEDEESYPWKAVWWGEHDQESDMAFYSTPPGPEMAGPGISRCRYGGFILCYPPGRLHDIWNDPYYEEFSNPSDRLLIAALEYNEKKTVVHLAKKPPHAKLHYIAGRMGQKIIHMPLSSVNPVLLGRTRRFHILDSRDRRDDTEGYIW